MSGHSMARVCAWCDAHQGTTSCAPAQDGLVTHGICPTCAEKQLRGIDGASFAPLVPPGFCDLSALAEVCGLPVSTLRAHRPRGWTEGAQFVARPEAWRRAFLGELVGELAVDGQPEAARRLLNWLMPDNFTAGCGAPGSPPGAGAPPRTSSALARESRRENWAQPWEDEHQ